MNLTLLYFRALLLIIYFAFLTFDGSSQSSDVSSDSISKYSYTIFGQIGKTPQLDMGTCFFYEKNGDLFLITAKHVLYSCESLINKQIPKFETVTIFIPTDFQFLNFRIPLLNDSCIINYKDTDLFVHKLDNRWLSKVNTIERFVKSPLKNFGKLEIFGQGMKGDSSYVGFDKQHNIELKENSFKFYLRPPVPDSNYIDTIHHFIETKEITVGSWMKGFSGSPVFLQDIKSNSWRFCGVFVQGLYRISDELPGGLILVSPNFVLATIDTIILNKKE